MRVWIDADACPRLARDQLVKFALKRGFEVVLVAGQAVARPNFACVKLVVVPSGPDAADDYLVEHAVPGELVICSDIPLADRLVKKGVAALDPRGREFDERNMGDKLATRNLFADLRDQGQMGGGQAAYSEKDRQAFANALDRILTRLMK
ncbi:MULTISPECIES: YaiI/YqxD family protein [unclassified Pseudomonas]|uniref:YaiI/YqxD family protein n=1 Tax=unclassified Pseudomonas TaxID=196821 RepID=UPI0010F49199|nr:MULTISPECIES: YaiI/YqxD family protein [unclassified Pseudomonas]MDG9922471.1 YaiI/YqxD family protein [Pseudomonas sp. GD04045]MDH0034331.1 YaiI/YqxD family protein [Pseudomonas sp. GD04019]